MNKAGFRSVIDTAFSKWIVAILTALGVVFALFTHFHERAPKLIYEIQSKGILFQKNETLSSVQLIVDTLDVMKSNQNVSFYSFRVRNIGNQNLVTSDYDEGDFGIVVQGGEILKGVSFSEASNEHIGRRYRDISPYTSRDFIEIPRIALDKGDWYSFAVAILHDDNVAPEFSALGKIIGQRNIEIVLASSERKSFWHQVFEGDIIVHMSRFSIYFFILLVFLFIVGSLTSWSIEVVDKRKRERINNVIARQSEILSFVRDDYLNNKSSSILIAEYYYELGDNRVNQLYDKAKLFVYDIKNIEDENYDKYKSIYLDLNRLVSSGYILRDMDGNLTIPREIMNSVHRLMEILESNKLVSFKGQNYSEYFDGIELPIVE